MWPPSIPGLVFGIAIAIAVTAIWATRWPAPEGVGARGWRWFVLIAAAVLIALFWAFALLLGLGAVLMAGLSKLNNPPRATRAPAPSRNRGRQRPAPTTPTPAPSSRPRRPTTAEAAIGGGPPGLWDPPRERPSHAAHPPPDVLTADLRDHEQALRDWQAFRRGDRHSP